MPTKLDAVIDFRQIFFKILNFRFFFGLSLIIAFSLALTYNRYSQELYRVETSIIIKEDNHIASASDLLYEKSFSNEKSIENKALMLKSFPLVYKTLHDLRFDISYYIKGKVKTSETYIAPFKLECANTQSIKGKKISIEFIDSNSFLFIDLSTREAKERQFDEKFLFYGVEISISYNILFSFDKNNNLPVTVVRFFDLTSLTQAYQNKIKVAQEDKKSTVINISLLSPDQNKGVVFLNKLTENYINKEVEEKNLASKNTVQFINKKLLDMRDSLSLIEQQIQEYKNNNQVSDLSLKAQSIYNNIIELESQSAQSKAIDYYYRDLSEYLKSTTNFERVSVPSLFGVHDENLNSLIKELVETQTKKNILMDGGQVNNPAIVQYNRQIKQLVINLQEAIRTRRLTNNLMLSESRRRIAEKEKQLGNLPKIERELLSIERLQSISEDIYIFLLKKRAEARITSSSNIADTKVLEPARRFNKTPVIPDKNNAYLLALILGILFPLLFILIREVINDKIVTRIDIENLTSISILSMISRNYSGHNLLSEQSPKSAVVEGFRALRSNLNFLTKKIDKKVYLVTSSMSGEGKTYVAENLAIVFANSGKKTLVIGADLRKPKLFNDFGLDNNIGISNYILDNKNLKEIICNTDINNLDILTSGPIPNNPADILIDKRFSDMILKLKQEYDIVIIDTPPLGLVADALNLMKYSDINLYVVRQEYTKKGLLAYVNDMNTEDRLGNLQIIFNDVKEGSGAYAYGYGYGYGYGDESYSYGEDSGYFDDHLHNK